MSNYFDQHIILFECCQLIKGYSRTLLVDFQRKSFELLDNEIYNIFNGTNRQLNVKSIIASYPEIAQKTIIEYLHFLVDSEYAFFCKKKELPLFPKLELVWEQPFEITNCIIDIDKEEEDLSKFERLICDLDKLGCENLQIRGYKPLDLSYFDKLILLTQKTIINNIGLTTVQKDSICDYKKYLISRPTIRELIIHTAKIDREFDTGDFQKLIITSQKLLDASNCGIISQKYFKLNLDHFLESNNYNTCLNKKISVDTNGNIKNCPSMKTIYGNIKNTSILDVVKQFEFCRLWTVKKDDIHVCKDCEFRHICTDCRAFLKSDFSFERPFKCKYNPYNNTTTI